MQMEVEKHVITLKVSHYLEEGGGDSSDVTGRATAWHGTARSRVYLKRSIMLPDCAETTPSKAAYNNGILSISFPKMARLSTATEVSET
jgi:HSP20 family molecular chaperone IbpA